jgi:hypothetical protein
MTIGDGIFYSTILLVLAGSIYAISVRGKWKTVGKVFSVFVLVGAVGGGIFYGYDQYQSRPQSSPPPAKPEPLAAVTEYMGIQLGASRVDVTLKHGLPEQESSPTRPDGKKQDVLTYDDFSVTLRGEEVANFVYMVCSDGSWPNARDLLGISNNWSEDGVISILGAPSSESIDADGLKKIMNYRELNLSLVLAEGRVDEICMTEGGSIRWFEEYDMEVQGEPESAD